MDFSLAQDYLSGQISKFREWGNKLGLMNIFTFENNQVQATPLVNSIVNLRSMIRTSVFRTESYELVEKNQETGEEKAIIYHDLAIKSPNVQNSIENQILELLDIQQIFLDKVNEFIKCVNELDIFYKIIIYHNYLKKSTDSITNIQINHIECCSLSTVYRMREKAVVELYEKLQLL